MIKRLLIAGLLLFSGLAHAACTDCDASAGYATVTVNGGADVDEVVEYFVIYLSDLPPSWHTAMSDASDTDGKSIRVADSTGVTQIACYPVGVNTTTDTGCLLVDAVGMSASADVAYRIYVGMTGATMPAVTDTYGRNAVFSGYAGYYLPGMSTADLTGAGRDLTAVGTPTTDTSGYEGITAAKYNGSSQYHHNTSATAVTNWPVTVEGLGFSTSTTATGTIAALGNTGSAFPVAGIALSGASADGAKTDFRGDSGSNANAEAGTYSASTWYYVAATRDANTGTAKAYLNTTTASNTTTITTPTFNNFAIGCWLRTGVIQPLPGRVAMAALSSSVRSANYISTINRMWATDIYTAGAWTAAGGAGDTGWVLFQTAATVAGVGDTAWTNPNNALIDDATYTESAVDNGEWSYELNLTNPAMTIPSGVTIATISYRMKRSAPSNDINDLNFYAIKAGSKVGTNLAGATQWVSTVGSFDYGGNLLGTSWASTDFGSTFGFSIMVEDGDGQPNPARVHTVWVRVTWTAAAGGDPAALTRGFFSLAE